MTGGAPAQARTFARRVVRRVSREIVERAAKHAPPLPAPMVGDHDAVVAQGRSVPFEAWERSGWHLTKADFLSPIPIVAELPESVFTTESELPGIDMRDEAQVAFLREVAQRFSEEYDALPRTSPDGTNTRYFLNNSAFETVDAEIYYSMLRLHQPRKIIEIGSGWSTLLSFEALRRNAAEGHPAKITAIEPYPYDYLREAVKANPDLVELWETPLQKVPLDTFQQLDEGDFLFIDSSHVLKIGSDVQYEFLEILPRLPSGVIVHVHDIFLPVEYPRQWVVDEHRFWNEQYLLQAYLVDNARVEVLWGGAWMHVKHPDELRKAIASYTAAGPPGSFWFRIR
jgi:predicted O-methyltransferase YrrM